MTYLMKRPIPPEGYRMLEEGKDTTTVYDLIWIVDNNNSANGYYNRRWARAIVNERDGLKVPSDTNVKYVEPKQVEDYCFFRCRQT